MHQSNNAGAIAPDNPVEQDKFLMAVASNARLIRKGISAYRADWVSARIAV
jgi:hypothetical protein